MKSLNITKGLLAVPFVILACGMIANASGYDPASGMIAGLILSLIGGFSRVTTGTTNTIITGTPVTFTGKEAREAIIEPAYMSPEISEFLSIVEDIVAQEQIIFAGRLSKLTMKDEGCGTGAINKNVGLTQKYWNPVQVKAWLTQCSKDLDGLFMVYWKGKGLAEKDLTVGLFKDFVMELMTPALRDDANRLIWFGDTAVDTILNGSFLNDGADIPFYNSINGLWKQIFAAVTGNTMVNAATANLTTANAAATYALQVLPAGESILIFRAMIQQADARLSSDKTKFILCTKSMFDNWLTYKETITIDRSFERQENGFDTDVYRGVKIIAVDMWDRTINSDMNNLTRWVLPHRAVMFVKENFKVGFDASAGVAEVKAFLDDVTEINHFKAQYKLDTKIMHDFMAIAAY